MQVKFIQSIASDVFSFRPGQIANVPEELVKKWIKSGICEAVPVEPTKKEEPQKKEKSEAPKK